MRDQDATAIVLMVKASLAPVLERLAAAEARIASVETLSTKDAIRIEGYAAAIQRDMVSLSERVAVVDARQPIPGPPGEPGAPGKDGAVIETPGVAVVTGPSPAEQELALVNRVEPLTKQMAALSERLAVMEVRAQVPGPAGQDGAAGQDGKDGVDGLGFDDLAVEQVSDRSFAIKAIRGELVKTIGTATIPAQIQRGVYLEGKSYEAGDVVTWGGSQWHCNEGTTLKPSEGTKAWTLVVKRGRDGKDGRDAVTVPVVSVGGQT